MSSKVVLERLPSDPAGKFGYNVEQFKRQRVYIFPTTQGWVYGLMLVVMLLGAINYNNSMAYMLCFLLTGLAIVCMLHTYRNLTGLIVTPGIPKAVYAKQQALFPIQFDNRAGFEKFSIQVEQRIKKKLFARRQEEAEKITVAISNSKQVNCYYPVQTQKRGLIKSKRLRISTDFPLGLFMAWSYFEPEQECLVYPEPVGSKQFPAFTVNDDNADHGTQAGTDDFAGFRKYKAGDPVHSIAWKTYAKEQGLFVKQFSGKGSKVLILNWEAVSHINNIETRLSQLCYWILLAEQASMQYGLEMPNSKIEIGHGEHHKELCLEALARYGI
ncbi:MAG: DUF58 domain-containing protein [Gammaproteobacteria bacterium]|jgi:uncharacterized protein (DUF58 family)